MRKGLISLLYICLCATPAFATTPAPLLPHASQNRHDIIVRQTAPMAFGTFASSAAGGTITIDAASGARKVLGAISTLSSGDYGQAEFLITGQPGEEVVVTPPGSVILGKSNGGDMTITDLQTMPADIITLDRQGLAKIKIGGTLHAPGSVSPGPYNAFFNVEVRYTR